MSELQGQWQGSTAPFLGYTMKGFERVITRYLFSPFSQCSKSGLSQCHFYHLCKPKGWEVTEDLTGCIWLNPLCAEQGWEAAYAVCDYSQKLLKTCGFHNKQKFYITFHKCTSRGVCHGCPGYTPLSCVLSFPLISASYSTAALSVQNEMWAT